MSSESSGRMGSTARPNGVAAFSLVLLASQGHYLLLERSETKRFAPGKWTGLGGRVEADELGDLRASALRELAEETGLEPAEIRRFTLRRSLLHNRPGEPVTLLLCFTGELSERSLVASDCPEGTLHWLGENELMGRDLIDNARVLIPLLAADMARDPDGSEMVAVGAARYAPDGRLERVVWA